MKEETVIVHCVIVIVVVGESLHERTRRFKESKNLPVRVACAQVNPDASQAAKPQLRHHHCVQGHQSGNRLRV